MKKIFLALALAALAFTAPVHAQSQAKEIAFVRPCPSGVPVYDKASGKIICGVLAQGGSGYVIEMASARSSTPSCPKGFDYVGDLDHASLAMRGIAGDGTMHYFACVKE